MLKAAEKRSDMYEDIKKVWKWIDGADAVLIGASNGLSITEGLHLFADNQVFEELFGDLKRKYGLRCILQGMGARWPTEEEKWGFWSRLVHHYCGKYQETQVMSDLKTVIGDKDYFVVKMCIRDRCSCVLFRAGNLDFTDPFLVLFHSFFHRSERLLFCLPCLFQNLVYI